MFLNKIYYTFKFLVPSAEDNAGYFVMCNDRIKQKYTGEKKQEAPDESKGGWRLNDRVPVPLEEFNICCR
jgi:hypothetical protein